MRNSGLGGLLVLSVLSSLPKCAPSLAQLTSVVVRHQARPAGVPAVRLLHASWAYGANEVTPQSTIADYGSGQAGLSAYAADGHEVLGSQDYGFSAGQCTWFVAAVVPNSQNPCDKSGTGRNACNWWGFAGDKGMSRGSTPQVGAIMCFDSGLSGSGGAGHVAVVLSIDGDTITVADANWVASSHVGIHTESPAYASWAHIQGYIYRSSDVNGADGPPPTIALQPPYEFPQGDRQGWSTLDLFDPNGPNSDTCWIMIPTSDDPRMWSPALTLVPDDAKYVEIRMSVNDDGGTAKLYWLPYDAPGWTGMCEAHSISWSLQNGGWPTYRIRLNLPTTIKRVRFDPIDRGRNAIGIDYIRFIPRGWPVAPTDLSPGELGLPFVFGTPVRLSWTDHPMTDGDVRAGNILEVYDWDSGQKLTVDALTNVSGDQHYFDWTPPRPGRFKWRSQAGDGIDRGTWSDWGYFVVGAPPQVVSAAYIDFTHVDLVFTEGLNKASAEAAANYTVDHGGAVTGAVLQADGKTVRLTTAWQVGDTTYTVTAAGVKDVNGIVLITGTGDSASWSTPEAWRRCDLDGDGTLGVADMKLFMDSWRKQGLGHGTDAAADFDGDGKISQADAERIVHDYLSREGK